MDKPSLKAFERLTEDDPKNAAFVLEEAYTQLTNVLAAKTDPSAIKLNVELIEYLINEGGYRDDKTNEQPAS